MSPIKINHIPLLNNPIIGFYYGDISQKGYFQRMDYDIDEYTAFAMKDGINLGNYYGKTRIPLSTLCKDLDFNGYHFFQFSDTQSLFSWLAGYKKITDFESERAEKNKTVYTKWLEKNFKKL